MDLRRDIKRRLAQVAWPMLGACLAGYFVYHAVQGDRGIIAWMRVNQQIRIAQAELDKSDADKAAMEQRVALLSNTSLDLDMLEERAKVMLNYTHPDDLVIFLNKPQPVAQVSAPQPAPPAPTSKKAAQKPAATKPTSTKPATN
ncbi:MAG TPA: septum formation initiator family protein [Candidatus Cybelea sp.]|nr:septum formation initiator family protein [Candidatus Cybelea sp.]